MVILGNTLSCIFFYFFIFKMNPIGDQSPCSSVHLDNSRTMERLL